MSHLSDLLQALPVRDSERVASFRREATHRCIQYPFGSGQAEEFALLAGLRPLIRQRLRSAELQATRALAERYRLRVAIAPRLFTAGSEGRDEEVEQEAVSGDDVFRTVLIGRDPAQVTRAVDCEADRDDRELGRLLGYPRCCVEAFVAAPFPRRNVDLLVASANRTTARFAPRLNIVDFAVFHHISWTPCSFGCGLSLRYADAVAALLDRRHPGFRVQIDDALGAHRLVLAEDVQVSVRGVWHGSGLRVEHAWPTAFDRHPAAVLGDDEREAIGRVLALIRGSRELSVDGNALRVDAERWALPGAPLLLPFGACAS